MAKEKDEILLELIGGIYVVERFPDGKEQRSEIDGELVLKLLLQHLEGALDELSRKDSPLREKLSKTRMEHVTRKGDRRKSEPKK